MTPTNTIAPDEVASRELRRLRLYAAGAAVWCISIWMVPGDLSPIWFAIGGWISVLGFGIPRALKLPRDLRRPTLLVALAGTSSLLSGIAREVHAGITGEHAPFPSPADGFILLSYVFFVAAILVVVRRRTRGRLGLDPLLDAVVAGIAAFLIQWCLVVVPYLQRPDIPAAATWVNLIFSVSSLALIVAAILALVAGSTPSPSNRLLAAGLVATFAGDFTATAVTEGRLPENALYFALSAAFAFGTVGLLHPSVRLLTTPPSDPDLGRRLSRRRIAVLSAALVSPPLLLLRASMAGDSGVDLWLPAVGALALAPVVLVRLGRLVRQNEDYAALEQTLREVGERLVGAETEEDVSRIIGVGLEQVLGDRMRDGGLIVDPLATGRDGSNPELALALRAFVSDAQFSANSPSAGLGRLSVDDGLMWRASAITSHGRLRAALVIATEDDLDPDAEKAVLALGREATIALRAVEQTERTVRRRSEERFGALVENSADILAVIDDDLNLVFVSPVAERLLGHDISRPEDIDVLDLVHPIDRPAAVDLFSAVRHGSTVMSAEMRLRHADGSHHWFEVVGMDLSDDPNLAGVVLNAREIGDRKAAEEQLQLSEARFKALVQHSSDLVLVVDAEGGLRYASPAASTIIGEDAEELTGRHIMAVLRDSGVEWDSVLRRHDPSGSHPELIEIGFRNSLGDWVHLEATVRDLRSEPAVGGFVLNARDVTERTSMLQRLRYQATHDDLTGLPNRVLAAEELAGMLGRNGGNSTVAVISLDVDDFKDVNDSLGHAFGDRLLQAMAERITGALQFGDVAARVGGDEFVVVLERAHGEARVLEVADALLSSIERPFTIDGRELSITASAGVSFDHDRSSPAEVLLRNADTAVYRAKQQGKHQVVVFEAHMHTASFDRLELRADLARAIETEQFVAHYQPIIDLQTGRITGAEALIRWNHPRRGLLSPAIFVPLAEETGVIGQLGEWILERACRDLADWRAACPELANHLTMSVNLSAQELHAPRLVPAVTDILARTGLPADRLVLEVTESNLLEDADHVQEQMARLRSLGTRLAIDDFGTGYSSLGYIQRYDFDVLKIDRSFVEGMERPTNRRIVTAVLDLARELEVRTVAEGIETEPQAEALTELGCTFGQGFLFSRPVPAADFRALLTSTAPRIRA